MRTPDPFWTWLESRPGRTAVMAEWRVVAGEALPAVEPMLQPLDRPATAYPNPNPGGRALDIVRHRDGTIAAVSADDRRQRIEPSLQDIVLHQLDLRTFRKRVCGALNLATARTEVDRDGSVVQIGSWEPKKAASFPVHLLMCRSKTTLREHTLQLLARCDKRAIRVFLQRTRHSSEPLPELSFPAGTRTFRSCLDKDPPSTRRRFCSSKG